MGFIWLMNKPKIHWSKIRIVSFLFLLALILSSILGVDFKTSLLGNPPYFQGFIVYAYLWLFSTIIVSSGIKLKNWAFLLTLSALVLSILVIKDWFLINIFNTPIPTYAGRVAASFGQPNFYAGFLLMSLPFNLSLRGKLGTVGATASMIAILISSSRIAIFFLALALLIWLYLKINAKKWFTVAILSSALIVVSAFYFSSRESTGVIWQEVIEPLSLQSKALANPDDSIEKRFYIWPLAWQLINQKPFWGWGVDNIEKVFSNYFQINKHSLFEENLNPSAVLIRLKDLTIDRTHNFSLDLLLFSGILGFPLWGLLVCLLIKKAQNKVLFASLILYLAWVQFQNQSIVHLIYFWLILAVIDKNPQEA